LARLLHVRMRALHVTPIANQVTVLLGLVFASLLAVVDEDYIG
uniref:Uncharacterized protein n=1 Tax=Acrobeloides nanus TaxID=290746 RepID=A0A914C5Q5_9BILA